MKFKVTLSPGIVDRESIHTESDFKSGGIVIGLDGKLYENYGTAEKPLWEEVFDEDYLIEVIE